MNRRPAVANGLPYFLFAAVVLLHCYNLARFVVDVPHWDEWDYVAGLDRVVRLGDWPWFFRRENEHLITLTKFQLYLAYLWNGWNVAAVQLVNFPLFLLVPILCFRSLRSVGMRAAPAIFYFFLFVLSPIAWENHSMSSQSCLHLVFLFLGTAATFLFRSKESWSALFAATAAGVLAGLSFANGVVGFLAIAFVYSAKQLLQRRAEPLARAATALLFSALIFAAFFWLTGLGGSGAYGSRLFSIDFWGYFFGLYVFGYGLHLGAGWAALVLGPALLALLLYPLYRSRHRFERKHWLFSAYVAAILAGLALIALGRTQAEGVNSSRYFEFAMLLPALTAMLWADHLADQPARRRLFLRALGAFLFVAFLDNWTFLPYRRVQEKRLAVLDCLRDVKAGRRSDPICRDASPHPIAPLLEAAERLGMPFTRKL